MNRTVSWVGALAVYDSATPSQLGALCQSYGFADVSACLAPEAMTNRIQERCEADAGLTALDRKLAECRGKEQ